MLDPNSVISAIYEVSAEMPKSPVSCGAGEVFSRFVAIGDKCLCKSATSGIESHLHRDSCKQVDSIEFAPIPAWGPALRMTFEHGGAGISEVTHRQV